MSVLPVQVDNTKTLLSWKIEVIPFSSVRVLNIKTNRCFSISDTNEFMIYCKNCAQHGFRWSLLMEQKYTLYRVVDVSRDSRK